MSETEIVSRQEIMLENYSKVVNIEALTMIEMVTRDVIPAVNAYTGRLAADINAKVAALGESSARVEKALAKKLSTLCADAYDLVQLLANAEKTAASQENHTKMAESYLEKVIPLMERIRNKVDTMETLTASEYWPFPTYGELLFGI
jgi:glutamine synthetase